MSSVPSSHSSIFSLPIPLVLRRSSPTIPSHHIPYLTKLTSTVERTLEELDYIFAVPGTKFIQYQTGKALPWWFNRWVLFRRGATLEPLYDMDRTIGGGGDDKDTRKMSLA